MGSEARKMLEQPLALPENEREELLVALSKSVKPEPVGLSPEWRAEVKRRVGEVRSGEVELVSWTDVKADLNEALGRK